MFELLLERIASALQAASIPYMIIGGQAVLVHGEPRLTRDIDITLGIDVDEIDRALATIEGLGFVPLVDPTSFTRETSVLPCRDPATEIRIDFIFSFLPYEREAIARANHVRIGNADVRFVTVEDLVVHKILAGRARDLEDVQNVLRKNPAADHTQIRQTLSAFAATLGEPLVERFDALL